MIPLVLASGNPGKLRELSAFFAGLPEGSRQWHLRLKPADLEIEETGETFAANAAQKAQGIALATQHWAIADDSGLNVDALGGRPGVYSARYAPTDPQRIARLCSELQGITDRGAEFCAAIALSDPQGRIRVAVEGRCRGLILEEARGSGGFGYDPVFWMPKAGLTFAEMTPVQKHELGHRGHALRLLQEQLQGLDIPG